MPAGSALADAGIDGTEDSLAVLTKLFNYINSTELCSEQMLHMVTRDDDDGLLDLAEFRDGLHEAGLNLAGFPQLLDRLGCLDLSVKRSVLQLLLDIEAAGGVRRAMVERVLARLCTALSIRDITAVILFAELDEDGSGAGRKK